MSQIAFTLPPGSGAPSAFTGPSLFGSIVPGLNAPSRMHMDPFFGSMLRDMDEFERSVFGPSSVNGLFSPFGLIEVTPTEVDTAKDNAGKTDDGAKTAASEVGTADTAPVDVTTTPKATPSAATKTSDSLIRHPGFRGSLFGPLSMASAFTDPYFAKQWEGVPTNCTLATDKKGQTFTSKADTGVKHFELPGGGKMTSHARRYSTVFSNKPFMDPSALQKMIAGSETTTEQAPSGGGKVLGEVTDDGGMTDVTNAESATATSARGGSHGTATSA